MSQVWQGASRGVGEVKYLKRLKNGATIINTGILTWVLVRLLQLPLFFFGRFWLWMFFLLITYTALAYTIGEMVELLLERLDDFLDLYRLNTTLNAHDSKKNDFEEMEK